MILWKLFILGIVTWNYKQSISSSYLKPYNCLKYLKSYNSANYHYWIGILETITVKMNDHYD